MSSPPPGWSAPTPIGPWSETGRRPRGSGQPPWLPPGRPYRGRRLAGWAIGLTTAYLILQGIRLGLSTARRSVGVTLAWDAGAIVLVTAVAGVSMRAARRRAGSGMTASALHPQTVLWVTIVMALTVAFSLIGRALSPAYASGQGIPGAAGYATYGGPHGYPLSAGKPWGSACQPLRFSVSSDVPSSDYDQIAAVIDSARADGVDVTIESPDFMWYPDRLYPPGLTDGTVQRIGIFPSWADPPRLSDGHLERIGFGWDAAMSPDGRHEHLTDLQATLYMSQLEGHPDRLRISIRQLIAFSQGVGSSREAGSGISRGATVDSFTPRDLRAMEIMSGCHYAQQ